MQHESGSAEQSNRPLTTEHMTADVCVIGGGPAGWAAAIASAREGAHTVLIHNRPVLGGNASTEVRVPPVGSASYNAYAADCGVFRDVILSERLRALDQMTEGQRSANFDLALYSEAKQEQFLDLYLNTQLISVTAEAESIVSIDALELTGGRKFRVQSRHFIDCTGDANLASLLSLPVMYGREGRAEYKEALAPLIADDEVMGSSILLRLIRHTEGKHISFVRPEWAHYFPDRSSFGVRGYPKPAGDVWGGFGFIEVSNPWHTVKDAEIIRHELYAYVLGVWDYLKNRSEYAAALASYDLDWVGQVPGKRESNRIQGYGLLTERDIRNRVVWPDAISMAGWYIDLHTSGGYNNREQPLVWDHSDIQYRHYSIVKPYQIPLRITMAKGMANLWMAGRNISCTHVVLGSARVMAILSTVGEAVGTAAAKAARGNLSTSEIAGMIHALDREDTSNDRYTMAQAWISELKLSILDYGGNIADVNRIDLARVTASSHKNLELFCELSSTCPTVEFTGLTVTDANKALPLSYKRAQVFPIANGRIQSLSVHLTKEDPGAVNIRYELQRLDELWQSTDGTLLAEGELSVDFTQANHVESVCLFDMDPAVFGKEHNGRFCRLVLFPAQGVSWCLSETYAPGCYNQYQYDSKQKQLYRQLLHTEEFTVPSSEADIPDFSLWCENNRLHQNFSMAISPPQAVYGLDNILDGQIRPWQSTHLCRLEAMDGHVELNLTWQQPVEVSKLVLVLDSDLNREASAMTIDSRPPELPEQIVIYKVSEDPTEGDLLLASEKSVVRHRNVLSWEKQMVRHLKIDLSKSRRGTIGIYDLMVLR